MNNEAPEVLSNPGYPMLVSGPLLALLFILAAIVIWWLWRKRGLTGASGDSGLQIRVATTRPLGPRSHLAIVEAGGTRSLIATTQQGVHFLRDLPLDAVEPTTGFGQHLDAATEETPS